MDYYSFGTPDGLSITDVINTNEYDFFCADPYENTDVRNSHLVMFISLGSRGECIHVMSERDRDKVQTFCEVVHL